MYPRTRISVAIFYFTLLSFILIHSSASQCTSNQFRCTTDRCVPLSYLCDGDNDCTDKSDEGEFCHCEIDKTFNRPDKQCLDKCQVLDLCSQKCQILNQNSHKCGCLPDFELNLDEKTCRGVNRNPSWIYYTVAGTLWRMNAHTKTGNKIQENLIRSGAVAADLESVYWDSGALWNQQIYGKRVYSTARVQTKSLNTGGDIRELAVDWWTGNLYCTVDKVNQIVVVGNAPNKFLVLISKGLRDPRAIALHPSSGRMFWSDQLDHYIGVAFMDGRGQRRLITTDLQYVRRLAVDEARERLYWLDHVLNKLESSTFEGQDRRVIKQQEKWGPQSLSLLEDDLVTGNYTHLFKLGKFRGGNEREMKFRNADVEVLSTMHPLIQGRNYDEENPCKKNPCSYMCLLAGHGRRSCVCGDDNRLEIGTECEQFSDKSDLLIGFHDTLYRVKFRGEEVPSVTKLFPAISLGDHQIDFLASDPKNGDVFIADNKQKEILRVDGQSGMVTKIAADGIGNISSMLFDEENNQLIFLDSVLRTLQSLNVTTTRRTLLYKFTDDSTPFTMALAPKRNLLFVAVNKNPVRVLQFDLLGITSSYLSLKANFDLGWKLDSSAANLTLTVDEKNFMLYVSLGNRLMGFDYDRELKSEVWNSSVQVNHMMLRVENGEFIYTGSDGMIYWGDKSINVSEFLEKDELKTIYTNIPISFSVARELNTETKSWTFTTILFLAILIITIIVVLGCFKLLAICYLKKRSAHERDRINRDSHLSMSNLLYSTQLRKDPMSSLD